MTALALTTTTHAFVLLAAGRLRTRVWVYSGMLALTDSALAPLCHLRHGSRPDRRRALDLLASCPDGCTEALMIAHGFTIEQWSSWCASGLRQRKPSASSPEANQSRSRG